MGKIISISLKLNFTPTTLGCYGLIEMRALKILLDNDDIYDGNNMRKLYMIVITKW